MGCECGGCAFQSGEVSELVDEHDLGSCAPKAWEFESPLPHQIVDKIENLFAQLLIGIVAARRQMRRVPGFRIDAQRRTFTGCCGSPVDDQLRPQLQWQLHTYPRLKVDSQPSAGTLRNPF